MKYKGIELVDISSTPRIINPPKKMLVWCDNDLEPRIDIVYAIGPCTLELPVRAISYDGRIATNCYKHCAEIPSPRRATNRELSKWLALGNGEVTEGDIATDPFTKTCLYYDSAKSNNECAYRVKVRKWCDEDWHEPTIDYIGLEVG